MKIIEDDCPVQGTPKERWEYFLSGMPAELADKLGPWTPQPRKRRKRPPIDPSTCLTVTEAARYLRVRQPDVERWIRTGELVGVDLGTAGRRKLRISHAALAEFLRARARRKKPSRKRDDIDPRVIADLSE